MLGMVVWSTPLLYVARISKDWFRLLLIDNMPTLNAGLNSSDIDFTQVWITAKSILSYVFWVNGLTLEAFLSSSLDPPPVSPFPFTRLASAAVVGSNSLYLYHQINETTIAEDQYEEVIGQWTSNNITIKTS